MDHAALLIVAMAERCRETLLKQQGGSPPLPLSLQPKYLLWMCGTLETQVEDWPATRLHRWIGFIQAGMMANGMIDLPEAKRMFDDAKIAHGDMHDDLVDHLDSSVFYEVDLGGEG